MLYIILMHISRLIFFANDITCCVFYIYFREGKWCQAKSKFKQFSYLSSKWVTKQWRQLSNALGPGTADTCTVQWWFKMFCKRDESLEDKEHSGQLSEVDNDKLWTIIKSDPLATTWEVAEELSVDHSMATQHLKQIRKVKKLDKWVPHELTKNNENCWFDMLSFFTLCNNKQLLDPIVLCDIMWILYDNQLSGWTKILQSSSQSQTCTKKEKKRSWPHMV